MKFADILSKMHQNSETPLGKTLSGFGQGMAQADPDTPVWQQLLTGAGGAAAQGIKGYKSRKKMPMADFTDTFSNIYNGA